MPLCACDKETSSFRDLEKDVLRMRVRDHDYLKSDDELGCAMYPVNAFEDKGNLDLNLELQGIGGGGVLSMSVKYLPFEGELHHHYCTVGNKMGRL